MGMNMCLHFPAPSCDINMWTGLLSATSTGRQARSTSSSAGDSGAAARGDQQSLFHAVAAHCGYAVGSWTQDHGGVDATVGAPHIVGAGHLAKPKVDIQLKATRRSDVEHEDYISWQLDASHYDGLVADATAPHLLVVLLLPSDADQTVEHTVSHLLIRRCAYWRVMTGMSAREPSAASKVVRIEKSQPFDPKALRSIMALISGGKRP